MKKPAFRMLDVETGEPMTRAQIVAEFVGGALLLIGAPLVIAVLFTAFNQ